MKFQLWSLKKTLAALKKKDLRKRTRYIHSCKNLARQKWTKEYLQVLRDDRNLQSKTKKNQLSKGEVMLIQGD